MTLINNVDIFIGQDPYGSRIRLCVCMQWSVLVGPCHHGMARPQVADRGTASDKEGSCE